MFKHILVPTDGSEVSGKATEKAIVFAREIGAKITFFCAEEKFPMVYVGAGAVFDAGTAVAFEEKEAEYIKSILDNAAKLASDAGVESNTVSLRADEPYLGIIEAAESNDCDMIYMGSRGRGGVAGLLLGSQAHKVLTNSKIPVLVYR